MSRSIARRAALAACALLGVALAPVRVPAQTPNVRREPRGFDFSPNGVWRRKAAVVRAARAAALARGDVTALNRAAAASLVGPNACGQGPLVICGVQRNPVFLVQFKNSNAPSLHAPAEYDAALLAATPPAGRPYTLRSYYEEISNGLFSIQGQVLGWTLLDSNDTYYEGNCNGDIAPGCFNGNGHVAALIAEAVAKNDASVDYGQFDNDGPDGIPNSGDDDGVVDLAILIHPDGDGACGSIIPNNKNIWSHRFVYQGWTGTQLTTNDNRFGGGKIRIDDYTIQSGVGGASGCDVTALMPVGTVAHETGHGLGLPDFYDTDPTDADDSEGIGDWGLMSSGNYSTSFSPAHMEGFSRMTVGWATVRNITTAGTYSIGPYTVGDTIFRVSPTAANPRNESWLIENRQGTLSDSALIRRKGPGLLIYHFDQVQYNQGFFGNRVNTGTIHGLRVEQADGLGNLDVNFSTGSANRGDAGDPFPGSSGNTVFGTTGNPTARLNAGGVAAGFVIDSIRQVVAGGAMAFRIRFGFPVTFTVSGPGTITATPSITSGTFLNTTDSVSLTAVANGPGVPFVGWSGDTTTTNPTLVLHATRAWTVVAGFASPIVVSDTVLGVPVVGAPFTDQLVVTGGSGTYTYTLLAGSLPTGLSLAANGVISGIASLDSTWNFTVRVTSGPQTLDLPLRMHTTAPTLAVATIVAQLLGGTAGLTTSEVAYLDLIGNHNNTLDIGDFVAWLDKTGNAVGAATMQRLMMRGAR